MIKSESGAFVMLRLTILLCAGLFLALQIGGEDRGQKRFGLMEAEAEAKALSRAVAEKAAAAQAAAPPAEPARADTPAEVIAVAFGSPRPLRESGPETRAATVPALAEPARVEPSEPAVNEAALTEDAAPQIMYVTGRAVNVRSGPSTGNDVVGRLTRGEAVTVISIEDNGWARIRIEGDGVDGFMSLDFLTDIAG
jgi:hypothetical protein